MEKESTRKWIMALEKASSTGKNVGLSKSILFKASKPRRQRVKVTLQKLDKYAKENDNIVVPGKILGTGKITKKFNVSAVEYSKSSLELLRASGCKVLDIESMIKNQNVKIII